MKKTFIVLVVILFSLSCYSQQIKVAIVDFDNTSGIAKYDGLGKAMSSMLISDIEANVSPKRLQLVERSQINKILKEQNFQKTSSVDKASTVKMGKLLGVKYLLVGDIFVLNDALVINSRLVDTETGDIKFTEKKEGKLIQWLFLKTALAKGLSTSISMPFTEPVVLDKEINSAVVTTFSNAITEKDKGNIDKSEELLKIVEEFSADFKYIDDIKAQLEELKKQVKKNTEDIKVLDIKIDETIENPFSLAKKYISENRNLNEAIYYLNIFLKRKDKYSALQPLNKKLFVYYRLAEAYNKLDKIPEAISYLDSCKNIDGYFMREKLLRVSILKKIDKKSGLNHSEEIVYIYNSILKYSREDSKKFNPQIIRNISERSLCKNYFDEACDFYDLSTISLDDGSEYIGSDGDMFLNLCRKIYVLNETSLYYYNNKNYVSAIKVLENGLSKVFNLLEENKDNYYSDISNKNINFDFNIISKYRDLIGQQNIDQQLFDKFYFFLHDEQSFAQSIEILAKCYIANNQIKKSISLLQYYFEIIDNFQDKSKSYSSDSESEFYIDKFLLSSDLYRMSIIINDVKAKNYFYIISSKLFDNPSVKKWLINEYGIEKDYSSFEKFSSSLLLETMKLNENNLKIDNKSSISIDFKRKSKEVLINSVNLKDIKNQNFLNKKVFALCYLEKINDDFNKSEQGIKYFSFNIKTLDNPLSDKSIQKYSSLNIFFDKTIFNSEIELIQNINVGDKITLIFTVIKNDENVVFGIGEFLKLEWGYYEDSNYNMKKIYDISKSNGLLVENEFGLAFSKCLTDKTDDLGRLDCYYSLGKINIKEIFKNDDYSLNNISWFISNSSNSNDELQLAEEFAARACYISNNTDHHFLDTYAFALFKNGKFELSKKILTKAIEVAQNENDTEALELYKKKLTNY